MPIWEDGFDQSISQNSTSYLLMIIDFIFQNMTNIQFDERYLT